MPKETLQNCCTSLLFTLFWAIMLWYILPEYVDTVDSFDDTTLPPSFWPKIIIIFGLLCSIFLFFTSLMAFFRSHIKTIPALVWKDEAKSALLILLLFLYMYSISYIGLMGASLLFLPAASYLYGEKSLVTLILFSLGTNGILYLFFVKVAQVTLPLGSLFY